MSLQVFDTDVASRRTKAQKIETILADALGGSLGQTRCLDVGCGIGMVTEMLAQAGAWAAGLEIEWALLKQGEGTAQRVQGSGVRLPFADSSFDVVVCAQVYEHIENAQALAGEIGRVLRPGGTCFFSGPNRLWPYEWHYGTWFIHWLPAPWTRAVLRLLGRGDLPAVTLYHYWQARRLWADYHLHDYWPTLLTELARFPGSGAPGWSAALPEWLLAPLACGVPNFNWILVK